MTLSLGTSQVPNSVGCEDSGSTTAARRRLQVSGLYYKPMTIVNDDSWDITKLETSLTDDTRVVIYDRHMFIVQATG